MKLLVSNRKLSIQDFNLEKMNLLFTGLLNLRGKDIRYNPVFYAFVLVSMDEIQLFVLDRSRITSEIEQHFIWEGIDIVVREYDEIRNGLLEMVNLFFKILSEFISTKFHKYFPA